jgi:hypothetical protein
MKSKNTLCGLVIAVALQLGMLAGSAQTNIYLFSGSKTNITLPPGTYIITAYGAPGGGVIYAGGLGAEMSAEFNFSTSTNLTLLVGGGASNFDAYGNLYGYGGGGGSFVVNGSTPLVIAGGGGGGYDGGENGSVRTNLRAHSNPSPSGYGGPGGYGDPQLVFTYSSGGGGGGGGFLGNGGDGYGNPFHSYGVTNGGGGGFSFQNGGGGIASDYGGGNGGYGGGSGGGYGGDYLDYGSGGGGGGYTGGGGGQGGDRGGYGGFSIIDSSAIAILTEISGTLSPDDPNNGEIIITAVPTPLVISTTGAAFGFTNGVFGFNLIGPSGSNVVIQASADLQTWIPLQTNLLGSGPLHFSDAQSTTNVRCFYRAQLSP